MKIYAVILAAGQGSRMGDVKQLLELGGKPVIRWVAEAACAARLDGVIVVLGAEGAQVAKALTGLRLTVVQNEAWLSGQASSLRCALDALPDDCAAVLFLLADQPLLDASLLERLVKHYRKSGGATVAPAYQGRRGNPVLFDLKHWRTALLGLSGDEGARALLADQEAIELVEVEDETVFDDLDTPQDYERMKLIWRRWRRS
ncbi:nucleotidyltransferase family protein [Azotosporobacter soli]|uniref:nucleotidyltransferase family protein n=1 Tax=Azotosporobacter soli TaxID=3055040 RepID=UPI0031FE9FE2